MHCLGKSWLAVACALPQAFRHLLSHAHTQHGHLSRKVPDGVSAHAGVGLWVSRAWAYDQLCGILGNEVVEGDFIVAEDGNVCALEDEVLVDIPGERVVVVDKHQVAGGLERRRGGGMVGRMVNEIGGTHRVECERGNVAEGGDGGVL